MVRQASAGTDTSTSGGLLAIRYRAISASMVSSERPMTSTVVRSLGGAEYGRPGAGG